MRFLLFISGICIFAAFSSCSSAYKGLQRAEGENDCIASFKPVFSRALYNTSVNVVGKHLSGLLIIKTMPDSSVRMVFSNEAGFKFFDFGFKKDDFTVYYIFEQMNKKPVIKTLRKDFQLVLMTHLQSADSYFLQKNDDYYHSFRDGKDYYHYVTDASCTKLLGMERAGRRKKVMEAVMQDYQNGIPDTIGIKHSNFSFTIELKRIHDAPDQ
jgi:hypothetical protein